MKSISNLLPALLGLGLLSSSSAFAAYDGATTQRNTPKFTHTSRIVGSIDPKSQQSVSIWLKPHDKPGLDALVKDVYNRNSANYRKFLTTEQYTARFAPTAEEAKTVQRFFESNQMHVTKVGAGNLYVRATGTVEAISSAFHVTLNNYEVKGKIVRGNSDDPYITGDAAGLVSSVAGLDSMGHTHPLVTRPNGIAPAASAKFNPETKSAASATKFNPNCFLGTTKATFTSASEPVSATYGGNLYTTDPAGCGYTPKDIQKAYGLDSLYKKHLDGTGQTVVIIDWCGSPTITSDANAFSAKFGLPKLTSKNFAILPTGTSLCSSPSAEINLDVEWVHAIAPGAKIALVVPPTDSFEDVDEALADVVMYHVGNVISGSYGSPEIYTNPSVLAEEDGICEAAAATGISANFSTGDSGDYTGDDPTNNPASASAPASSSYATAIGGISLALKRDGTIDWQSGWGTNTNLVALEGTVFDPPTDSGFYAGSGGGPSVYFAKPPYQESLLGPARLLPDISWVADPFTGAYIAISEPGTLPELVYEAIGGTSLSCPMFSALWAITIQAAGQDLGQAAPYLYDAPAGAITDIVPLTSKYDVVGKITDPDGTTFYSGPALAAPLGNTTKFISALDKYSLYKDTGEIVTFGTDTGLTVSPGWDDVTGLGVPNPKVFVESFIQVQK